MSFLKRHYELIDILFLFAILFIGSDIYGITFMNMNFRFVQLYYVFLALFVIIKYKYCLYLPKSLIILSILFFISSCFALNFNKSIVFFFWLIYNIIFVFSLFYTYIKIRGKDNFIDIFRYTFFIIFLLTLILFILGNFFHIEFPFFSYQNHKNVARVAIWFFEPSYLASFITMYLGFSFYNFFINKKKEYLFDTIFAFFSIVFTTSSTGFIACALAIIICFIIKTILIKNVKQKVTTAFIGILLLAAAFICVLVFFPNVYNAFIKRLYVDGLFNSLGTRMREYSNTFSLFLKYPFFGVGPNCYGLYYGNENLQPTNVTLELLATTGIFTTLVFYVFFLNPIKIYFSKNNYSLETKAMVFALILFLIIIQANQNYMRLYMWMLLAICYAMINEETKKEEIC